ncbi:MFS general substrate transporter [Fomitiporia mediterranea MF3/22]|uniref:MFS general substrate transporter n=1 Tax=Fomitiporia mediterranea (strain MF3/22) TaxID=694068 RepID=UPI0004407A41|nr:MFS general substrate transporter [Fomitiporia mediterranea MF3/22]EJD01118.1 MFS general substrate transporter [Fomitiporia mediterranea MF3/22]
MSSAKHSIEEKQVTEEPIPVDTTDPDAEFGGFEERQKLERKLLWKLDCRMSIMIVIYILNYIDRNNAAAARLRGLEADLHLKGQDFNTLLSILYVGYILMQIPSNMFLNHIGRPSLYLPVCMMIWGMISVLTGITTGFIGALLTRFFLGFVEAAFFPGALFLLSKWYTRSELGLRISILYCGNIISNAFGSLMASGILDGMEGKLGHQAWRWLFYIEGAITIAVAFAAIFILPDFPTTTRWLTPLERSLALRRMAEDGGIKIDDEEGAEVLSQNPEGALGSTIVPKDKQGRLTRHGHGFWLAVRDWKVWWLTVAFTAEVTALSFNAFFPTLTATLGFNSIITLILAAPPWFLTAVVAFFNARHSDKHGERFWHIVGPLFVGIVGFIIAISTMKLAARYVALFLMSLSYVGYIVMFAWISNSVPRPPSKRAVALALINCLSQTGNVAGSYVWQVKWGPSYRNSYGICIALQGLTIIMCWIFRQHLKSLNERLEREEAERGDKKKGFRYLL